LNNSPKVPLSNNRIVDANEIGQLLERLRISVPSSIMESERTVAERERILSEAETEAKRIIAQARQRANEMVNADNLVSMARKEAERLVDEGRLQARLRADEADAYATQVLEDLAAKLNATAKQVENGLQIMRNRRQSERPEAPVAARAEPKG
jgi:vacuolar-type H+-ATPase subunit H